MSWLSLLETRLACTPFRKKFSRLMGPKRITPSCQGPQKFHGAQCVLETINACLGFMGSQFHAPTARIYKIEHGVKAPLWPDHFIEMVFVNGKMIGSFNFLVARFVWPAYPSYMHLKNARLVTSR